MRAGEGRLLKLQRTDRRDHRKLSRQLIVAGFHRSGTSLVTQLLHRAGLFVGDKLLGASASNFYGHFEDREVKRLHNNILADNGRSWLADRRFAPFVGRSRWEALQGFVERRNADHRLWGFKDPRVCLFLPLWRHLLPEARVLVVYRHFADSTDSLGRRHTMDLLREAGSAEEHLRVLKEPDLPLRMWLGHNEALLDFARRHPDDTLVVPFEEIQRGFPLVRFLNRRWRLGLDETSTAPFDPGLTTRRAGSQTLCDKRLIGRVEGVWQALEQIGRRSEALLEA